MQQSKSSVYQSFNNNLLEKGEAWVRGYDNPCVHCIDARVVTSFGPGILPITICTVLNGSSLNCTELADASCDHSMDLGVVCRTYKQLYDEFLAEQTRTDPPQTGVTELITCPESSATTQSCDCPTVTSKAELNTKAELANKQPNERVEDCVSHNYVLSGVSLLKLL